MKNNTDSDYKKRIKAKFEIERKGIFHSFLDNPSPAQLRELCLLKYDNGLDKIDETIFRIFFKVTENEDLRAAIFNYHIPLFKSVGNYLTAATPDKATSIKNLNLIAVLIDFKPRPFNKFHQNGPLEDGEKGVAIHANEVKKIAINALKAEAVIQRTEYTIQPKNNFKKKLGYGFIGVLGLFTAGYTTKDLLYPEKQCMKWVEDHYESVDCIQEAQSVGSYGTIVPYDEREFGRRELTVCDTTEFFVEGNSKKPKVWYDKEKDGLRYFNMNGVNPETGDHLRPMTLYMIGKHVESSE